MKTGQVQLTEEAINSRLNHRSFLQLTEKTSGIKARKIVRSVDKKEQAILLTLGIEDFILQSNVSVHPEFVAYAFHLYGLSRILLLYIIFFELNNNTGRFTNDAQMVQRFRGFCSVFGEEGATDKTIQQALRNLVRKNTMICISGEQYMLNPLIAGGANETRRKKLINQYSEYLQENGRDTSKDFYPKYLPIK